MVLEVRNPSAYNEMLGRRSKPSSQELKNPSRTSERAAKRLKRSEVIEDADEHNDSDPGIPPPTLKHRAARHGARVVSGREIQDSEADSEDDNLDDEPSSTQRTDLEQALPPIKTDKEAIQEYEALRAAEGADSSDLRERLGQRKWVKGKSSIYVDAFNLALETVLEDESHLFDEPEMKVFQEWRDLSYEAQYL